ncbi:MAG: hypothetical protein GY786_23025, partial [Proteobacteria bacterium]|nr:hypothetical protein [Pseudomonadota bacterium]
MIVSETLMLNIIRLQHPFFIFQLALAIHFVYEVLKFEKTKWIIKLYYLIACIMIFFTQSDHYLSAAKSHFYGISPISGIVLKTFAIMGLTAFIHTTFLLYKKSRSETNPHKKLQLGFIFFGFILNTALTLGNFLPTAGVIIYPPANFSFIPLSFMAYGLLYHQLLDISKSWYKEGIIARNLAAMLWIPVIIAILFVYFAESGVFHPGAVKFFFLYAIPPIVSTFVCLGVASFILLRGNWNLLSTLLSISCGFWGMAHLYMSIVTLLADEHLVLQIIRIGHVFLVSQLGISIHIAYLLLGRKDRLLVHICYGVGILLIPFTQTTYYISNSLYQYSFGYSEKAGFLLDLFGVICLFAIAWSIYLYFKEKKDGVADRRLKQKFWIFWGVLLNTLLNIMSLPATQAIELYPPGNFSFIPILMIAYGILQQDIISTNHFFRRKLKEKVVALMLGVGYLLPVFMLFYILLDYELEYLWIWWIPDSIPLIFSLIICGFLLILCIRFAQSKKRFLVFGVICLLGSMLSIEILVNSILLDPDIALRIKRWVHLFIVFLPALFIHLAHHLIHKTEKKLLYSAYGIG